MVPRFSVPVEPSVDMEILAESSLVKLIGTPAGKYLEIPLPDSEAPKLFETVINVELVIEATRFVS